ncbi:hypothetical protein [Bradyrhizobium sp. CB3481]|uniref:hypothetical protein n=1 Tax=Bradyrhizobium sp. CB3481 TaxID=3039158 RepID=UPI0024B169F6|nr:hypothetical protein [Bradyrhizobium sp. CB3481]WFU14062.1 hypothetical protein QA643_22850 [Bradyrhizobium sp. CB3481]
MIFFAAQWLGYDIGNGLAIFELPVATDRKDRAMGQQVQGWRSASGQRSWLSKLIQTMEQISRPDRRAVPCDAQLLATVRAQLARPALAPSSFASTYSLRN